MSELYDLYNVILQFCFCKNRFLILHFFHACPYISRQSNKHDTMIASPFFPSSVLFLGLLLHDFKRIFWACLSFSDCFTYATVVIHVLEINNEGNFLVLCKKYDSYHHNPLPFLSLALCHLFFLLKIYQ